VVVNMAVAVILHKLHGGTVNAQQPLFGIPLTTKSFRYVHLVWVMSFLVANVWNFQLNRSWTFRASRHGTWLGQFLPFLTIGSAAAGAGLLLISLFTHADSPIYLPEPWFSETAGLRSRTYWAQLFTIVATTPINFVVNKLWTFRAVRQHRSDEQLPLLAPVLAADLVDEQGHLDAATAARPGRDR
jgi:putative flippase GtrA